MQKISKNILYVVLAICFVRLISLGMYPLFDPTEGRYAEIGRKMLETGNWVTPFIEYNEPFWAKPPLSFWMTAISYKIFGVSEFAARLPSFLCMMGILWLVFGLAKVNTIKLSTRNPYPDPLQEGGGIEQQILAAMILASMALFFYLGGGVMTDPSLAFGITLTMVAFWRSVVWQQKIWGWVFFAGVVISLLAKGPVGVILPGMAIFLWVLSKNKWKDLWQGLPWVYGTLLVIALVLPWYILAEMRTPGFLRYFIIGEHFERFVVKGWKGDLYGGGRAHPIGMIWLYGIVAMLPWPALLVFPSLGRKMLAAIFALKNIFKNKHVVERNHPPQREVMEKSLQLYLLLWAFTPLVFFTLARNVLATYTIAALPAIALLITPFVCRFIQERRGYYAVVVTSLFLPVIFILALFIVNIYPDARFIKSEKQIVRAYQELAKGSDIPLIYIPKRPYSAAFYSNGKSLIVASRDELREYFSRDVMIVVARGYYRDMPDDFKKKLEIVAEKNNSILLRNIR